MNKTLIINAHPKIDDTSSVSLQVFNHFLNAYKEAEKATSRLAPKLILS